MTEEFIFDLRALDRLAPLGTPAYRKKMESLEDNDLDRLLALTSKRSRSPLVSYQVTVCLILWLFIALQRSIGASSASSHGKTQKREGAPHRLSLTSLTHSVVLLHSESPS